MKFDNILKTSVTLGFTIKIIPFKSENHYYFATYAV